MFHNKTYRLWNVSHLPSPQRLDAASQANVFSRVLASTTKPRRNAVAITDSSRHQILGLAAWPKLLTTKNEETVMHALPSTGAVLTGTTKTLRSPGPLNEGWSKGHLEPRKK